MYYSKIKFVSILLSLIIIYILESYMNIISRSEFSLTRLIFIPNFDFLPFSVDIFLLLFLGLPMLTITYCLIILKRYTRITKTHLLKHHFCMIYYYVLTQLITVQLILIYGGISKYFFESKQCFITFANYKMQIEHEDAFNTIILLSSLLATSVNYVMINMLIEFLMLCYKLKLKLGKYIVDRRVLNEIIKAVLYHAVPNLVLYICLMGRTYCFMNSIRIILLIIVYGNVFGLVAIMVGMKIYRVECGWILPELIPE